MTQLVRSPWRTANRLRVATYQALEKIN
jgi:hypothetical protein